MSKFVNPVPRGYGTVTPMVTVENVQKVVDFAKDALGGQVEHQTNASDGKVWHAAVKIGNSMVMFGDTMGMHPSMPACLYLYVDNPDALYQKAIKAGAKSIEEPKDMFYGDHAGGVTDPAGNMWWFASRIEEIAPDEMKRRAAEQERKMKASQSQAKKAA